MPDANIEPIKMTASRMSGTNKMDAREPTAHTRLRSAEAGLGGCSHQPGQVELELERLGSPETPVISSPSVYPKCPACWNVLIDTGSRMSTIQ